MSGEIIRKDDPTSHGGRVIEGSQADICHGKPIAYMGHKVYCPQCKGTFPIIEGAATTTFYGNGVALAGMKTACGAVLIATQFTDIVVLGGGGQVPGAIAHDGQRARAGASNASAATAVASPPAAVAVPAGSAIDQLIEEEHFYTLVDENGNAPEGYLYDLHCDDTLHTKAGRYVNGTTAKLLGKKSSRMVTWLKKDGGSRS